MFPRSITRCFLRRPEPLNHKWAQSLAQGNFRMYSVRAKAGAQPVWLSLFDSLLIMSLKLQIILDDKLPGSMNRIRFIPAGHELNLVNESLKLFLVI